MDLLDRILALDHLHYETSHGRTYHAFQSGKYIYRTMRVSRRGWTFTITLLGRLSRTSSSFAPIERPSGILDISTGTGIWAIDAADAYPEAEVVGIDLSPIQPRWVPSNLQFEILDADAPWGFRDHHFSLFHVRIMNGFGVASWPHFY